MYERLISQCERHQAEALADYDILYPCLDAQRVIRTRLVTPEVTNILPLALNFHPISHPYLSSIASFLHTYRNATTTPLLGILGQKKEYRAILNFFNWNTNSAECTNCNKFWRSAHALRLWLRNCPNDLCRAFESVLPDWCVRGTSLSDVPSGSSSVESSRSSLIFNGTTVPDGCRADEEGSDPMLEWVQCEDCNK